MYNFVDLDDAARQTGLFIADALGNCVRHCPQADIFFGLFFGVGYDVPGTTMTSAGKSSNFCGHPRVESFLNVAPPARLPAIEYNGGDNQYLVD